tara:strand:+ start:322 stop:507 length:186 start_codon:yes stop_codon:yes gene_type:complete
MMGMSTTEKGKLMSAKLETFDENADDFGNRADLGKLQDRYDCYVEFSNEDFPKTFDEWLNS